ncbi:bi-domain-containing oxidoreductase [Verrucomicrobiales bacterium]|nr:bi-domain-containing oxidoreductase [Verrucomicrobiales bacterium]
MKQIVQNLKNGETLLVEVPVPCVRSGHVLIKTHNSLVSLGTEKMLVDFGKSNYFQKAIQQPEKVKQVLSKIKTDGLNPTLKAVQSKLEEPIVLGYSSAGEVIGIGDGVKGFTCGDRVVCNGPHSEVVNVPENLVAKIPDGVKYEHATFTVVGAIALQGIRLIQPTFGEAIVVTGLGLIGLITVQILKANGCRVIGLDFDSDKIELAKSFGVEAYDASKIDVINLIEDLTNGVGVDGILITASSKSNEVISQSAKICRQRGRIVLVGVIGLDINRSDFYKKEITFQVSCSYGPGRYNTNYEEKGFDYPIGFVRWTEQRNFEAILSAISDKRINVDSLITEKVALEEYAKIYSELDKKGSIASIINYEPNDLDESRSVVLQGNDFSKSKGVIGVIGSGNFTRAMILPTLKKIGANIKYIASSGGLSGTNLAKKYGIGISTSDMEIIFNDSDVDAVVITTRHNHHSTHVIKALEAGKHVFVEKPLAIKLEDLNDIEGLYNKSNRSLTVGFNRRFSPFARHAKELISVDDQPINVIATMNAGFISMDHWVHDLEVGGGRIIGEACHYIDLISFLTESEVVSVVMNAQGVTPQMDTDNASILLRYKNGSQGVINYFSNGNKGYPKERIEIFERQKNIIIDNFRKISFYGYRAKNQKITQDKGHLEQFRQWNEMIIQGGEEIIPFSSIVNTAKSTVACLESLKKRKWVDVE